MTGPLRCHDHSLSERLQLDKELEGTMAPISESLTKLSTSMAELSQRAKQAEDHAAAARTEAHDQLEVRVTETKAAAEQRHKEMESRRVEIKDDLGDAWADLRSHAHEQFGKMRVTLDEKRDDHDAAVAERRAQRAELNAEDAANFAIFAVDEAEAAVLEAIDARAVADALA